MKVCSGEKAIYKSIKVTTVYILHGILTIAQLYFWEFKYFCDHLHVVSIFKPSLLIRRDVPNIVPCRAAHRYRNILSIVLHPLKKWSKNQLDSGATCDRSRFHVCRCFENCGISSCCWSSCRWEQQLPIMVTSSIVVIETLENAVGYHEWWHVHVQFEKMLNLLLMLS